MHNVQETVLNRKTFDQVEQPELETELYKPRDKGDLKIPKEQLKSKEKKKPVEAIKSKFEISLPGDTVLAG